LNDYKVLLCYLVAIILDPSKVFSGSKMYCIHNMLINVQQ